MTTAPKILTGKTAIVVGSTSGIGEAIAEEFAREGASVVVSGRRTERGESVVERIREAGGQALFTRTDAGVPEQLKGLIDKTVEQFGKLDILVNNAAVELTKPFAECTLDDYEKVMNLNLRSYYLGSIYALQHMLQQQSGVILNINSVTSERPVPGVGLYAMAKGAIRLMTKTIALEYARQGIRANEICPGLIQTEIFNDPVAAELAKFGVAQTPVGRIGTPQECAKAALYLVSDSAQFTTGASLFVDGGITI